MNYDINKKLSKKTSGKTSKKAIQIQKQEKSFTTFIRNYSIFLNIIYDELLNANIKNTKEFENFLNTILLDLLVEK